MSALSASPGGRALIERQMTSTVRYFTVGDPVTDSDTGEVTRAEIDPVLCKARVRPATLRDYPAQAGGAEVFATNYVVSVPYAQTPVPAVKQRIVVVSSPDPALVGVSMQIRDVALGDQITARRMLCYKVSA